jgi:hypothetical protein
MLFASLKSSTPNIPSSVGAILIGREAIKTWRENPEHKEVQRLGRELFYSWYEIQVVKVDMQYEWSLGE